MVLVTLIKYDFKHKNKCHMQPKVTRKQARPAPRPREAPPTTLSRLQVFTFQIYFFAIFSRNAIVKR